MKPKFFDVPTQNTGTIVAQFVYCPERDGLISIRNCKLCEKYNGLKQYEGVKCKTTCTRTAPAYYNKKRYHISD